MGLDEEIIIYFSNITSVSKNNINRDSMFGDDLGLDSLDMVETAIYIEDKYNLDLPAEEFDQMSTVGHIIDYVVKYRNDVGAGNSDRKK